MKQIFLQIITWKQMETDFDKTNEKRRGVTYQHNHRKVF